MDLAICPGFRVGRRQRNGRGLDRYGSRCARGSVKTNAVIIDILLVRIGSDNLPKDDLRISYRDSAAAGCRDSGDELVSTLAGTVPGEIPKLARATNARVWRIGRTRIERYISRTDGETNDNVRGVEIGFNADGHGTLRWRGRCHVRQCDHVGFSIGINFRRRYDDVSDDCDRTRFYQSGRFKRCVADVRVGYINGVQEIRGVVVKIRQLKREF